MYKLIVAGGRHFSDYNMVFHSVKEFIKEQNIKPPITIVSGGATGADKLGEQLATHAGLEIERYTPDWSLYGNGAGHVRNKQMAEVADGCIVFWDGKSRGTQSMIDYAKQKSLDLKVVRYY